MVKSQGAELGLKGRALNWYVLPLKESSGLAVHGNLEISVVQVDAVGPHSWKEHSSDGLCRLHLGTLGLQELGQGLEVDDWMNPSGLLGDLRSLNQQIVRQALRPLLHTGCRSVSGGSPSLLDSWGT